ncbi:MAG: MetQ/NlpA family ABC transporter substrate-binding protein [Gammaproteobacteria bacterium]|nr:MetQ/NlpA family ABC transporter substrate-binding protein [Gammaproteobacteria bacterium]
MKKFGNLLFVFACTLILTCCSQSTKNNPNKIRVGTIAGPETSLMEVAQNVAAKEYGLDIDVVEFTDYVLPNQALADGSIDANMFQHLPYLEQTIAAKHYKLSPIGKTFIYPMGIYSTKIAHLDQLKDNAIVAIPNDPSNEARALMLLEKAGVIKLKPGLALKATSQDIIDNPKHIQIKELDAAQLPRILSDADLAVINTNYAMMGGLLPSKNALFVEGSDSPYANIVVIRTADKDDPKFVKLMNALHSPEVVNRAKKLFQGEAVPAW